MSKSAITRARYFAARKNRRDEQNNYNQQNNLRPVSLATMKKITPPAPKPKFVKVVENKQIEIAPAIVEKREVQVEKQVLRAATKQLKKIATIATAKAAIFKYPKKVKITLNKVVAKKKAAPAKKAKPIAKKIVKAAPKKTNKKVVAVVKKKIAPVKKAAPKKMVKATKKVTKNKKK
ncbi:hypothetical protein [Flavobacterium sp.]|uniref:hypothetical protein n=1 Tax=Flavobacterium sp. TaxID=239 RepID=UPI0038FCF187